jgi:leucyl aminopeptidase (aminopeptidase T)
MLPSFPESTRRRFARNLLRNALRLRRGESLLVETWSATLPWAVSTTEEARAVGAYPLLSVHDEEAYWRSLGERPTGQFAGIGEHEWAALSASDAYVCFYGPMDTAREEALPPAAARRAEANNHELMRVIQKYGVRTLRWDLGRTSPLWARRYGVDLKEWRRELIDAAMVDPRGMRRDGRRIADRLRRGRELTITHPNGTHLALRLAHRRPRVDDGIIDEQDVRDGNVMLVVPAGVTSVTVQETHAEGTLVSNATGVLFLSNAEIPLAPGRWTFRDGELTGVDRGAGGRRLRSALESLEHPRVRPGQISVGLNPRITTIPLLFDQQRGVITLEIGRNAQLGGRSRSPHLIAYLDLHGGTLEVDGEPLVERGRLVSR